MSLNGIAFPLIARCCLMLCAMAFTMAPAKCGGGGGAGPATTLPPGLEQSDLTAAAAVLRQRTETEDMVRQFKRGSFDAHQIEFVMSKYDGPMTKANALLDRIGKDIDATPTAQDEDAFKHQATDAVGDCVVLDSLLETALHPGISPLNLSNYVLRNANSLPGWWVDVWKASRKLGPAEKQQFLVYLDRELKWKTWQAIH